MTDNLIALVVRETGWSLEYIREQPLHHLYALVEEIRYLQAIEEYNHSHDAALIVCALVSTRTKRYKPRDIIGGPPERRDMTTKKLTNVPTVHKLVLLDEKEYELPIMNLNLMADLEEEFGVGLEEVSNLLQTRQMSTLRRTLYVMLRKKTPDMTKESIGDLVDLTNLEHVATVLGKVLSGE